MVHLGSCEWCELVSARSAVQRACREAVAAADTFLSLLDEPAAAERARRQLDMALSVLRCASCERLADMREKCRTFRRLEELLSPGHPRLQPVACDLVREMTDLLESQDGHRIASETVAPVDSGLLQRGSASEAPATTEIAAAHHAVLMAIQDILRLDRSTFMRARELLAKAIDLDPDYAAAHAWMAYWGLIAIGQGWVGDPHDVRTLAVASADRAVLLDPLDARTLAIAGHVKSYLQHDVSSALNLHERAIELNPNLSIAWALSSWSRIYNGEHATAIQHAMMSRSLSPRDPHIFLAEHALMTAHFFSHHLEEAEQLAEVVLQRLPRHVSALNVRLAILGHTGCYEQATECLGMLHEIDPNVSIERIISRPPLQADDQAFYIEGLRRASVPQ